MKVLQKYISIEFIKLFILCEVIFLAMFLVIDFIQRLDNFLEAGVLKGKILSYFLYKIPYMMVQMWPIAVLIAVIILFCALKKNNEIMAMKACGIDIFELSRHIIAVSLLLSIISFLLSDKVVPYSSSKGNEIWEIGVEKQAPARFYGSDQIWYKTSNAIYWIKHFDSTANTMQNPIFYFFDKDFRLIKKIEAKRGTWQNGLWKLEEGIIQVAHDNGDYEVSRFKDLFLEIAETPDSFKRRIIEPEDMSYQQLKRYAGTVGAEGYDNTEYLVDLNLKLSFPLISLILALLGIPVALGLKTGGTSLAVSAGIGLCFLYYVVMGFSRSLGLSGILPPLLSAWTANLLFAFLGTYMIMTLER
jgi:lipopolysaccharide export system permease protein